MLLSNVCDVAFIAYLSQIKFSTNILLCYNMIIS